MQRGKPSKPFTTRRIYERAKTVHLFNTLPNKTISINIAHEHLPAHVLSTYKRNFQFLLSKFLNFADVFQFKSSSFYIFKRWKIQVEIPNFQISTPYIGVDYKSHYGIEISWKQFSTYKEIHTTSFCCSFRLRHRWRSLWGVFQKALIHIDIPQLSPLPEISDA